MTSTNPTLEFLNSQTAVLSRQLVAPKQHPSHDEIPSKAVNLALDKLNRQIRQHATSVYSQTAQRHVDEQIRAVYTPLISQGSRRLKGEVVLPKGFVEDGVGIDSLPEGEDLGDENIRAAYEESRQNLIRLKGAVSELRRKKAALSKLKEEFDVLRDPSATVQGELVGVRSAWNDEMKAVRVQTVELGRWVAELENEGGEGRTEKPSPQDVAVGLVKDL